MKFACDALLCAGIALTSSAEFCNFPVRDVPLPVYAPPIQVRDSNGRDLLPRILPTGEFADLKVFVAYEDADKPWVPTSLEEAAFALREMLPNDYYERLLSNYNSEHRRLMSNGDVAVDERVWDIARFIEESWGLTWSGKKHSVEALVDIVDYAKAGESQLPERCD